MNARAEFKGTGHTQLSSSRHFICKPTLPSQTLSNLLYIQPYTKPTNPLQNLTGLTTSTNLTILYLTPCELFFELLLTHLLFIPFGVKPCLLL